MKEEFLEYKEALALKEIGFDEPCFAGYNSKDRRNKQFTYPSTQDSNTTSKPRVYKEYSSRGMNDIIKTPTYQQAFKWFRNKHKILSFITYTKKDDFEWVMPNIYDAPYAQPYFSTYEEAELACIKKLIEIVKEKK
jgi:hypothetical protein